MPRYIDADELLRKSFRIEGHFDLPNGKAQNFSAISVTEILDFPTDDVTPVIHGCWKPIYSNKACEAIKRAMWYKCSECGGCVTSGEGYARGIDYEFCPYCGAKMGGDDNEV